MNVNPFFHGNPVPADMFVGRTEILRRIISRIANNGQSTAIVGEPRTGKTSLLNALVAEFNRLAGSPILGLSICSSIDIHMLGGQGTPAQFWQYALASVEAHPLTETLPSVKAQLKICRENDYGTFTLEALFRAFQSTGCQFVLLIDEFDNLVHQPMLNSAEFFGGLRSVASRSDGGLALVIASRLSLAALNTITQEFNPTGSPYFNIFAEMLLGPLTHEEVQVLLSRSDGRFNGLEHHTLEVLAGGHPYLLQAAASALWEAYENGIPDVYERLNYMNEQLSREEMHFQETWRLWSPETRKAFTTVALADFDQQVATLTGREFLTAVFVSELKDYMPELNDLKAAGIIAPAADSRSGWKVVPTIMLWWLAEELVRVTRSDESFDSWLKAQQMRSLLTQGEIDQLEQLMKSANQFLGGGVKVLLETLMRSFGDKLLP